MAPCVRPGKMAAEPAIEPDIRLIQRDHTFLDGTHSRGFLHPFGPQTVPMLQTARNLAFQPTARRLIEAGTLHPLGEIVLPGEGLVLAMVVGIALAIAEFAHQLGRRIADMGGRHQGYRSRGRPSAPQRRPYRRRSISARCRDRRPPVPRPARPPGCRAAHRVCQAVSVTTSACGSAMPISSAAKRSSRRAM